MKEEVLEQLKAIFEIMADDRFTESVADFCWNLYTKLQAKGFTKDEAIRIVTSMNQNRK